MRFHSRNKYELRKDFTIGSRAASYHYHDVIITVKQNNIEEKIRILNDISNLTSPNYGKYLSFEEVGYLSRYPESINKVKLWLIENDIEILEQTRFGEYFRVRSQVQTYERIFNTEFYEFEHVNVFNGNELRTLKLKRSPIPKTKVIRAVNYSLPEELFSHIGGVYSLVNLPHLNIPSPTIQELESKNNGDHSKNFVIGEYNIPNVSASYATSSFSNLIYPGLLKKMYNIFGTGNGFGSQSVYESSGEFILLSDLTYFQNRFNQTIVNISSFPNGLPSGNACKNADTVKSCEEASLDLQYLLSISGDVPTSYWYDSFGYDYTTWVITLSTMESPPLVLSISYGTYEVAVNTFELNEFDQAAINLSLRGVTIVASSGDDGVTGFLFRSVYSLDYCGYYASWPASSMYVTAVGGTQGGTDVNNNPRTPETVFSSDTGSAGTSGGGFSNYFPAPQWQRDAVVNYFNQFNTSTMPVQSDYIAYIATNRAYPDVSLAASLYVIAINNRLYSTSGTSASAPVFAGMVSLGRVLVPSALIVCI